MTRNDVAKANLSCMAYGNKQNKEDKTMLKVTKATFEQEVLQSEVPVLIDFFADWCMPCKMFAPIFEGVAEDYEGKVKFVKVNIDESPELAQKYLVMSIPTLKLVKGEELLGSFVGAMTTEELEDWVEEHLA